MERNVSVQWHGCADGRYVGYTALERLANAENVYIRAGAHCDAGGIASYMNLEP